MLTAIKGLILFYIYITEFLDIFNAFHFLFILIGFKQLRGIKWQKHVENLEEEVEQIKSYH